MLAVSEDPSAALAPLRRRIAIFDRSGRHDGWVGPRAAQAPIDQRRADQSAGPGGRTLVIFTLHHMNIFVSINLFVVQNHKAVA